MEYFDEHLSHNDYYSQNQTQAGHWIGMGCERLGLTDQVVTRDAFRQLCDNLNPQTGERLTQVMGSHRRIFFDFQCAPPKSVSILAVTMDDQRIVQAHQEAATIALRELERFAATRIRMGGIEDKDRVTGNLVGASFMHTSSRALDPQLHTHFVLFNATWDQKEQRWKALQTSGMFDAIHYGTEVYRNELVKRLHQFGYRTRQTAGAFEIDGVDPKFIERFSKRSKERDAAVAKEQQRLGRKLTKDEVANVVHQTRPKKLKGASDEQVRQQQLGEIGFFEKRELRKVVAGASGTSQDFPPRVTELEAVEHGLAHVFERDSVVPEHRILEAALIKGRGQIDLRQLKEKLAQDNRLVHVGAEYSTRDILRRELSLIRMVNDGLEAVAPVTRHYEPPAQLGLDQRKALAHVLTSPDRVTGFRGLAGSGKSTTLAELAKALHQRGYEAVFCAPTASAADTLRRDGLEAVTLDSFYGSLRLQSRLSPQAVIVLDEAGAVGLDAMARLLDLARRRDCRVVLSGDTGQHASVARGDALRILEKYSGYRFGELTTIRRQKPKDFRQVVELAAAKQTGKAFAKLLELGAVTELPTEDGKLYQRAAKAYLFAIRQGKSALLVSPTWAEIEAVTERVRDALKAQGVVGQREETVTVFDSLSWTEAQRKDLSQFAPGQRLRFVRHTKHFGRGDTVEVVATAGNDLCVRRADGSEVNFTPASVSASFDVGEARELKVAAGDWLLLQANQGREFINGERVQVREIQNGRIALADGRMLPAGFNAFTHGYAVTSHSSQSKTVDEVLLVASSRSLAAVSREQFYVSISRGRERVRIFTDDTELLGQRVADSHERKAAIELQGLRDDLAKLGFTRRSEPMTKDTAPAKTKNVRAMRSLNLRPRRATRLSPAQCLATVIEDVRRRVEEWLGSEPKETVAETKTVREKIRQTESVKHPETVKPAKAVRPAATVEESPAITKTVREREDIRRQLKQRISQNKGIRHSGGMGV